jgi:GNAT superfamily N-acetyltransferase
MKLLRETIRRLILESVNTKLSHAIEVLQDQSLSVSIRSGPEAFLVQITEDGEQVGYISAEKAGPDHGSVQTPCLGAFILDYVEVDEHLRGTGIGALLYDVAMELAGNDGFVSDRASVKPEAARNWNYFYNSEEHIKAPLDTHDGQFTDDPNDNCKSNHSYVYGSPKIQFQQDPLNNAYYKRDQSQPTITRLRELGLIGQ